MQFLKCFLILGVLAGFVCSASAQDTPTRVGVVTSINTETGLMCVDGPVIPLAGLDVVLSDGSTVTATAAVQSGDLKKGTQIAVDLQAGTTDLVVLRIRVLESGTEVEGGPNVIVGSVGAVDLTAGELEMADLCFPIVEGTVFEDSDVAISIEDLNVGDLISVQVGTPVSGSTRPRATEVVRVTQSPAPREGQVTSIDRSAGVIFIEGVTFRVPKDSIRVAVSEDDDISFEDAVSSGVLKSGVRIEVVVVNNPDFLIASTIRILGDEETVEAGPARLVGRIDRIDLQTGEIELAELRYPLASDVVITGGDDSLEELEPGDVVQIFVGTPAAGGTRPRAGVITVVAQAPPPRLGQIASIDRENGLICIEDATVYFSAQNVEVVLSDGETDVTAADARQQGLLVAGARVALDLKAGTDSLIAVRIRILEAEEDGEPGPSVIVGNIEQVDLQTGEIELRELCFVITSATDFIGANGDSLSLDDLHVGDVIELSVAGAQPGDRPPVTQIDRVNRVVPRTGHISSIDADAGLICLEGVSFTFASTMEVFTSDDELVGVADAGLAAGVNIAVTLQFGTGGLVASRIEILAEDEEASAGATRLVGKIATVDWSTGTIEMGELCFPVSGSTLFVDEGSDVLELSNLGIGDLVAIFVGSATGGERPRATTVVRTGTGGGLPTGTRGPVALDLDKTVGDQKVLQTSTRPKVGDSVTIDVVITEGGTGLNGFNVRLKFDPAQLQYQSFATSDVFSGGVVIENKDNIATGVIGLNVAYFGSTTTSKVAGTMGQAVFKVLAGFSGETRVSIESAQLATGGVAAPVTVGPGGSAVVIGGAVVVPSDPVAASDIDGDGQVGFSDFVSFAQGFGQKSTDANYNARLDLDGDGEISFSDFIKFAQSFGKKVGGGKPATKSVVPELHDTAHMGLQVRSGAQDLVEVDVTLNQVQGVTAYAFDLVYNVQMLELVSTQTLVPSRLTGLVGDPVLQVVSQPGQITLADAPVDASGNLMRLTFRVLNPTGIEGLDLINAQFGDGTGLVFALPDVRLAVGAVPSSYELAQNFPNPFNPETVVPFALPEAGQVKIAIYNALGQEVRVLVNEFYTAGQHRIVWDGRNVRGHLVSSGIYFVRMVAGEHLFVRKMALLK